MIDLLTAAEAAKVLGIKPRTMYALAAAGKVASYRIGVGDGAVRFKPTDLSAYLESCRSPVTSQGAGSSSSTVSLTDGLA